MMAQAWPRVASHAARHARSSDCISERAMRVLFIGTGEIGVPALRWLRDSGEHELVGVVTQPDKPVGRDQRIQPPPIKAELGCTLISQSCNRNASSATKQCSESARSRLT